MRTPSTTTAPGASQPRAARPPAEANLASQLRLSVARLHRRLRQSADPGLTISQLSALASIERSGPITLGDLARVEQVQPPTMTALAGKLEAAGLVARSIDATDRRVNRVAVSAQGAHLLARHRKQKNAYLERRLATLSASDRATLARACDIMEQLTR